MQHPHVSDESYVGEFELGTQPERTEIKRSENEIRLKIKAKVKGKLIQIFSQNDKVWGVDEVGYLFVYDSNTDEWTEIKVGFFVKWVSVSENEIIYVLSKTGELF
eukprot:UN27827